MAVSTEGWTRLQEIEEYTVHYKPKDGRVRPALWDCPKVIQEAARGNPPKAKRWEIVAGLKAGWPVLVMLSLGLASLVDSQPLPFKPGIPLLALLFGAAFIVHSLIESPRDYGREKALFDEFAANPELFRDEIFKAAVQRLPVVDFNGRHVPIDEAKIGRFEREVIEGLRKLGVQQETTVAHRGRPFLIHQYELRELRWGRWSDGGTKNYVLDLAILWPERRIKFDIEVDDPEHERVERRLKDVDRDRVLTDRGWFVRRFNHNFMRDEARVSKGLREILGVIYHFAKYANDEPIDKTQAWVQNRRLLDELRQERRKAADWSPPAK